jgi:steroid delta-isomerase
MAATAEQTRAVIETYVKAWVTHDKQLLMSIFAKDATWCDPVGTMAFSGHEGISKFWDFVHEDSSRHMQPKVNRIVVCGDEGLLDFTMQVRVPAHNQGVDLHVIDRFVLNDAGKIQTAQAYWDENCASAPPGMQMFAPDLEGAYEK